MKIKQYLISSILFTLLIFTGCLERKETITISNNGETTIIYELDGSLEAFEKSQSYPTDDRWDILEEKQYTDKDGNTKIKMKASQIINPDEKFPESFASSSSDKFPLQFPTELKIWKEGKKTYYRFERTYQARMFIRFNFPEELEDNEELEERVLTDGIFNVPESDRNQYIENLSMSIMYHTYAIYLEAIGDMILHDAFPLSKKQSTEMAISDYIEKAFADSIILKILALNESSMDSAYDKLLSKVESQVTKIISDATETDQSKDNAPFKVSVSKVKGMYDITEAVSSDKFSVSLNLPGSIISTNGLTEPDEQGLVYWEFSGKDLHDAHIPLFALSVVEN